MFRGFVLLFFLHGDVKFVGRPLKVSLRGHIFNYWLTNNISVQIPSSLQNRNKVEIVMITVAVFDQIAM
jgi:hypothetical protein